MTCLEEFDPGVKEAAAWTLGYIAGHNAELAQQIVDAGMLSSQGYLGHQCKVESEFILIYSAQVQCHFLFFVCKSRS